MSRLFPLGKVEYGQGLLSALSDCGPASALMAELRISGALERHVSGDWGEVSEEDRKMNNEALRTGGKLLSIYTLSGGSRVYIITAADRSCTRVLRPYAIQD